MGPIQAAKLAAKLKEGLDAIKKTAEASKNDPKAAVKGVLVPVIDLATKFAKKADASPELGEFAQSAMDFLKAAKTKGPDGKVDYAGALKLLTGKNGVLSSAAAVIAKMANPSAPNASQTQSKTPTPGTSPNSGTTLSSGAAPGKAPAASKPAAGKFAKMKQAADSFKQNFNKETKETAAAKKGLDDAKGAEAILNALLTSAIARANAVGFGSAVGGAIKNAVKDKFGAKKETLPVTNPPNSSQPDAGKKKATTLAAANASQVASDDKKKSAAQTPPTPTQTQDQTLGQ